MTTIKEHQDVQQTALREDSDESGALAALRRAAKKARQQAIDDEGYVATWRDGKIVYDTKA